MGDFLAELFDQFDPEEQARIRAAEDSIGGILAQGGAAVRDRQLAAGSTVLTDWVLEPEDDARADAAGVVFAAYVNALWHQTDPGRSESIQEFGAKVDKLVAPVLARYGREGEGNIAELREKCWRSVQLLLQRSTLSEASGAAEHGNMGSAELGDDLLISVKPWAILDFVEPWGTRRRRYADLNATYTRRRKNGPDAEGVENLLRSARGWAEPLLRGLVSEAQDVFDLKQRVVKQSFDKFIAEDSYFWKRYHEFASALWEEGRPSLDDHAIVAMAERATSAASQAEAVVTGSLAEGRCGDPARLAGIPSQESAEEAMADLADLPEQSRNRIEFIRAQAELDLGGSQPTEEKATGYVLRVFTTILEEALKAARKEGWPAERLRCFLEKHREAEIDDAYYSRHPAGLDPEAQERYLAFDRRRGFGDRSLGSLKGTFRGRVLQRISSSPEWKGYLQNSSEIGRAHV